MNPSRQDAAINFAAKGWAVFPCGVDKKPLTPHGLKDATTDPEQIKAWWTRTPGASIGSPTGPNMGKSGAWVLDVDLPDGPAALAALEYKNGPLPATVEQRTGGGGRQLFFLCSEGREVRNSASKIGPGLDVRGAGGYVILPPSGHPSGGTYAWTGNGAPLAPAPEWLLKLVTPPSRPEAPKPPTSAPAKSAGTTPYGRRALEEEAAKVAGTAQGGRNHALNAAAFVVAQLVAGGELDRAEAEAMLMAAAGQCGLSEGEARQAIRSGSKAGEKEPRQAPEKHANKPARTPQAAPGALEVAGVPLDEWEPTARKPWPRLDRAALPDLVGDFVDLATMNSEADPAAVLTTFLVRFACEAGGPDPTTRPHLFIGDSRHEPRLFAAVVGQSSKARKGTSASPVARMFSLDNSENSENSLRMSATSPGPLSSGEGVVWNVRDELRAWEVDKKTGAGQWLVKDPGIPDKRLNIADEELAAGLRCIKRDGNTLSTALRGLWDNGTVHPLTKSSPSKTTQAHVNIVAHITLEELSRVLDEVELFNGFANRFLWTLARRTRLVSRPKPMPTGELAKLQGVLVDRLRFAHKVGLMAQASDTSALWDDVYPTLSVERGGLFGAVVGRAEAQVQRLSMVYALLDGKAVVNGRHLEAALAFWRYSEASAAYIFDGRQADPVREKITTALRATSGPMTATGLHRALGNSFSKEQLQTALDALIASGLVAHEKEATKTKPRNLFRLCEFSEFSEVSPISRERPGDNSDNSPASNENEAARIMWDGPAEVEI